MKDPTEPNLDEMRKLTTQYNHKLKVKNIWKYKKKDLSNHIKNKLKYKFVKTATGWDMKPTVEMKRKPTTRTTFIKRKPKK